MTVGAVLVDVLVVLLAAKVAAEVAERVHLPAVVGEIVAGVVIGPSALHLVGDDNALRVLGELGVILLLLEVGMEMDLAELGAVGRASLLVAITGVIGPFVLGYAGTLALGEPSRTALFIGGALTATSVGVTARVFGELRALASAEARTVLGAAVADDVIGLVILTVVVRVAVGGSVSLAHIGLIVATAVGFLAISGAAGSRLAPPLFDILQRRSRSAGTLVAVALAFTLGISELARAAQLAPIVGAFVAGLALARTRQSERIHRELRPLGHVFIPVFFLQIGIDARISEFAHVHVLAVAGVLCAAAVAGKLVSPLGAVGSPGDKTLIGLGMLPRGEVGLIFATLGLHDRVLGQDVYAALLLVVLVTTLVTPPLLRWRLGRLRADRSAARGQGGVEPSGGWLTRDDGEVELAATPPDHTALPVAFRAALLASEARPGPRLLDWLESIGSAPLRWDAKATRAFIDMLRDGTVRSWRLLVLSGVLERALPDLAQALQRRSVDPLELDPTHAMRWDLLERLREVTAGDATAAAELARIAHRERLQIAALLIDATGGATGQAVATARRIVQRLGLGAGAEEDVAFFVDEHDLFAAVARRSDSFEEEAILQLAAHVATPDRARGLFLLAAAGNIDQWERLRLDELRSLVTDALAHPELTGRESTNLVERRRREALRSLPAGSPAAARVETAPRAYLLAQPVDAVARQAQLLEPPPARSTVKVEATPGDGNIWHVDITARDRTGLLAAVTGALTELGLAVIRAVVATWPDGMALDTFDVVTADGVDTAALAAATEARFDVTLSVPPLAAEIRFDDGSPWYTICGVRAPDQPGLLHRLCVALTAAGCNIHSAKIDTVAGAADDRFELTDTNGHRLDDRTRAAVVSAVRDGAQIRRRRWRSRKTLTQTKHGADTTETSVS